MTTEPEVVVTKLFTMTALALLSTRLVAMVPFTARDWPSPKALPPEDSTVLSAVALMMASSNAVTVTEAAVTSALPIRASTALRTSFLTTRPPMAMESEPVTLTPSGTKSVAESDCQYPTSL